MGQAAAWNVKTRLPVRQIDILGTDHLRRARLRQCVALWAVGQRLTGGHIPFDTGTRVGADRPTCALHQQQAGGSAEQRKKAHALETRDPLPGCVLSHIRPLIPHHFPLAFFHLS